MAEAAKAPLGRLFSRFACSIPYAYTYLWPGVARVSVGSGICEQKQGHSVSIRHPYPKSAARTP